MDSKITTTVFPTEQTGEKKDEVKPSIQESGLLSNEMQHCAERIWNSLSKLMTLDKDGVLKDPNWPHLWDHKK
ncbi:MAG: hypothetical protein WC749_07600 [Dehalococcoidia bacterium]